MADNEDTSLNHAIAQLHLWWTDAVDDKQGNKRALIEVTNGTGNLFLPRGRQGERGLDGEPGPAMAPNALVAYATDAEALQYLPTLGALDKGYCVLNQTTKTAFFWSGTAWLQVQNAVGLQGPAGPPIAVGVGTVSTSPSGGSAQVALDPSSTDTNKIFNFTLPRGEKGAVGVGQVGPPGDALSQAGDVQWPLGGPSQGETMVWDAALAKAVWQLMTPGPAGPYSIGEEGITAINDNAWPNDLKQVGKVTVPAQDFRWHPRCYGYVDVKVNGIMARVDLEARLGSMSGPVVGRGPGTQITGFLENYTTRVLVPTFEGPMTPSAVASSVAAGVAADIYLVIHRIDTLATFGVQTRKDRASFTVYADPVPQGTV